MSCDLKGKWVYISGPVGGGFAEFARAERDCIDAGAAMVVNPAVLIAKVESGKLTREEATRMNLRGLTQCDVIVMLDGWGISDAAALEYQIAKDIGIDVMTEWAVRLGR